jgi:hypothetical protein
VGGFVVASSALRGAAENQLFVLVVGFVVGFVVSSSALRCVRPKERQLFVLVVVFVVVVVSSSALRGVRGAAESHPHWPPPPVPPLFVFVVGSSALRGVRGAAERALAVWGDRIDRPRVAEIAACMRDVWNAAPKGAQSTTKRA